MENDRDIASIAKGLTKAQRRQVLRGSIGDASMTLVHRLIGMGLMHLRIDSPNGRYGFVENTALGNRVRTHLLANTGDYKGGER